jgi:hypothetical protein
VETNIEGMPAEGMPRCMRCPATWPTTRAVTEPRVESSVTVLPTGGGERKKCEAVGRPRGISPVESPGRIPLAFEKFPADG